MNKVTLFGHVGNDPKIYTGTNANNQPYIIARLSLATNRVVKNAQTGEKTEYTTWHDLKADGKTAETIRDHVSKGRGLIIEGELRRKDDYLVDAVCAETGQTLMKPDGTPFKVKQRGGTEVRISRLYFAGPKPQGNNAYQQNGVAPQAVQYTQPGVTLPAAQAQYAPTVQYAQQATVATPQAMPATPAPQVATAPTPPPVQTVDPVAQAMNTPVQNQAPANGLTI